MPLIERYLFRQLLGPTLWAIVALAAVGILTKSLSGLDLIVDQRLSAWVFAKITLLAMPQILNLIVPLAVFVAGLVTLNRLHTEQEIVVCYAGGVGRWRIVSPALRLATLFTLVSLISNLWLQPLALSNMRAELNAARADLTAALVHEGRFTTPATGLTVYAQSIDRGGLIHNLFINHEKPGSQPITYTAAEGLLTRRGDAPVLLMKNGATQSFGRNGELNYLAFDEYVFDLSAFQVINLAPTIKASDRYMSDLLNPAPDDEWGQANRHAMLAEFNNRIASALYSLTFMAFALSAVLGGQFSRMGYGKRIAVLSVIAIGIRLIGFMSQEAASSDPALNIVQYFPPVGGFVVALGAFLYGGRRRHRLVLLQPSAA